MKRRQLCNKCEKVTRHNSSWECILCTQPKIEVKKVEKQQTLKKINKEEELQLIKDEINKCSKCLVSELDINKLNKSKGHGKVSFNINLKAEVIFIAQNPSSYRDTHNDAPFSNKEYEIKRGKSGAFFFKMLEDAGIPQEKIIVANLASCSSLDNKLTKEMTANCSEYIYRIIRIVNPLLVVQLGKFKFNYKGIKIINTLHPAFVMRNTHLFSYYKQIFKEIKEVIR